MPRCSAALAGAAIVGTAVSILACGGAQKESVSPAAVRVSRHFDYVAVGGARFGTETTLGRATVVVFITTYDLVSQALIRRLGDMVRERKVRVNAGAIVLEPPRNQPLVEAFAEALETPFPIALADQATLERRGPFGPIEVVPTVIVLDPKGMETWRKEGAPAPAELEAALDDASR